MWSVPEITTNLPAGMVATEDEDHLTVRCLRCGTELVYSRRHATPARILADAAAHTERCRDPGLPEETPG